MNNIEKHSGNVYYTGYGAGDVWRIRKQPSGFWRAIAINSGKAFTVRSLQEVSAQLETLSASTKV
jgi:hypothetical protein